MSKRVLILFLFSLSTAFLYAKPNADVHGYLNLGLEYNRLIDTGVPVAEAEIKLDVEIHDNVDLSLKCEGDITERELKDFSGWIRLKFDNGFKIKTGYLKKRFGLEKSEGIEDLYMINRSVISRLIAPMNYFSKDYGFIFYHKDLCLNEQNLFSYYLGLYINQSYAAILNPRFELALKDTHFFGVDLIYQRTITPTDYLEKNFAFSLDYAYQNVAFYADTEIFGGTDHLKSVFYSDRVVWFGAWKTQFAYQFDREGIIERIEPVLLLDMMIPDVELYESCVVETVLGVNFYIFNKETRLQVNAGPVFYFDDQMTEKVCLLDGESKAAVQIQSKW